MHIPEIVSANTYTLSTLCFSPVCHLSYLATYCPYGFVGIQILAFPYILN